MGNSCRGKLAFGTPATVTPPRKFLLLGCGGAGKSTICKIFELQKELRQRAEGEKVALLSRFAEPIVRNIINLLFECFKIAKPEDLTSDSWALHAKLEMLSIEPMKNLNELRELVHAIWQEPSIKSAAEIISLQVDTSSTNIGDCVLNFLSRLDEILVEGYLPTIQDALSVRQNTYSNNCVYFKENKLDIVLVDMSGQVHERWFWNSHYHDLSLVIFTVAASDYNVLEDADDEDSSDGGRQGQRRSKIYQSLKIWREQVCGNELLRDVPKLILLNKTDLLERKLKYTNFRTFFPTYDGHPQDSTRVLNFIAKLFLDSSPKTQELPIVRHTCALDQDLVSKVMHDVVLKITEMSVSRSYLGSSATYPVQHSASTNHEYPNSTPTHLTTA